MDTIWHARAGLCTRSSRRVAIGAAAVLHFLLLVGCAAPESRYGLGTRGAAAPEDAAHADDLAALRGAIPCCRSLAELPYETLPVDRDETLSLTLDAKAPAFEFSTGKSFFAAFRLPDGPRPLEICMTSTRSRPADGALAFSERRHPQPVFHPAALILDERFRVNRLAQDLDGFHAEFTPGLMGGSKRLDSLSGCVYVDGPPEANAYLVFLTTDELRARRLALEGDTVVEGFSSVGTVTLQARSMPFARLPVRYRGAAVCAEKGGSGLFWTHADVLLVSESGVHCLAQQRGRYVERIRIPPSQVVSGRVGYDVFEGEQLILETAEAPNSPIERRTIAINLPVEPKRRVAEKKALEDAIAASLVPGWYREGVYVAAADSVPSVEIRSADGAPKSAGERISDTAGKLGAITAFPCVFCQLGVCTPDVLVGCAGLFAAGATVGAGVALGYELATGGFGTSPPAAGRPEQVLESLASQARLASGERLAQTTLRDCVTRPSPGGRLWVHQGRAAVLDPDLSGARFVLETSIDRFVLVKKQDKTGAAEEKIESATEVPVQLVLEGSLVFRERSGRREERRSVRWEGPVHTVAEWTRPGTDMLGKVLQEGCNGLAAAILTAAETLWKPK